MNIENALIFNTDAKKFLHGSISFENGIITDITYDGKSERDAIRIIPGLVEVHTHGRNGYDIMDCSSSDICRMSSHYAQCGVTSLFPTVMTAPYEKMISSIEAIKEASYNSVCNIDGIHVEGPYISPKRPGCHTKELIRKPLPEEICDLIKRIQPLKSHITIAPEESCALDAIAEGTLLKASFGIGHSDASFAQCADALQAGAVSFTHTFNAMSPLLHREPGCVGCALSSNAYAEFIVDGIHIDRNVIGLAYKIKENGKFVLVTDSIAAAGMPDGNYSLAGIPVTVSNGKITTSDGTIAGSALSMPKAIENLMEFAKIPFEKALICATAAPARQVGIYDVCGSLRVGKRADFVLLGNRGVFDVENVAVNGKFLF